MNDSIFSPQALNKAMLEAVEFIHAEGWDAGPTLFALVPTEMLVDTLDEAADDSPLTLVVQDNLPDNLLPGSEALGDYVSRLAWPAEIAGAVLAQEIMFTDAAVAGSEPRPARLFPAFCAAKQNSPFCSFAPPKRNWQNADRLLKMKSNCAAAQGLHRV